jgi:demethylmenaquinone methyltransferase/2-methoxy-6-polyprenyl-1,4-benzoquinol methylase
MPLRDRLATPEGKRRYVRSLFATIARRYDFITVALSYGRDRRWKQRLLDLAPPLAGLRALDLATGTGDIAFALSARGAVVVGLDVTDAMIRLAQGKATAHPHTPAFVVGDMMALPLPAASFDVVTTGYGLRNVPDIGTAIDEIGRVLKPGGHALSLDFNRPANAVVRGAYLLYLNAVGGALGWALHGDAETYRYIPASIRTYPGAEAVARLFGARGFVDVGWIPVLGGLMAIHHARKA